jgi:excisionase family DNA binding protein
MSFDREHIRLRRAALDAEGARSELESEGDLDQIIRDIWTALEDIRSLVSDSKKSHYTVRDIARLTGRSDYTVRRWITAGQLRADRVAGTGPKGRLLIPHEQLSRLIATGRGAVIDALTAGSVDRPPEGGLS